MKKIFFKMFGMVCNEYANGWYSVLKRTGRYNLYRADGKLVAKDVIGCDVFYNGWYRIENKGIPVSYDGALIAEEARYSLYTENGRLIADRLVDCYVEDGKCTLKTGEGWSTIPA